MNNFQLGVKSHQEGDFLDARQRYQEHLRQHPDDFNALQLLGLVYSSLGDIDGAIAHLQQSLTINPEQPYVINSLGVCQKKQGLYKEAQACFAQSINLKNDYLDPHKNLIRLLLDIKNHKEARLALENAKEHLTNHSALKKLEADYHHSVENYTRAIALLEELLEADPNSILMKHSLALNLRMQGQSARALEFYNELEQGGLKRFQLFHNKANAMADLGQLEGAIEYYRKAIKENPAYVESHKNLSGLLWEIGEQKTFLSSYIDAFHLLPSDLELRFSYAATLVRVGEYSVAYDFLTQFSKLAEKDYRYYDLIGKAYKGLGDKTKALAMQRKAYEFDNIPSAISISLAETLLELEFYSEAQKVIDECLRHEPNNKHAWAVLGLAWTMLGDPRSEILNDYDNLVREYTIETPEGFDNIQDFCQQLGTYLKGLHTAKRQPLEQTLAGGTQTQGNLFNDSNPLVRALVKSIEECVRDYIKNIKELEGALPIIKSHDSFHFSGSWSVLLKQNGFHNQHVHPMGWISSAFYVQLPDSIDDEQEKQGWLKIGPSNIDLVESVAHQKHIKPAVGKLVLFQSYMWHGTIPFSSNEERITVAFDVAQNEQNPMLD